MAAKVGKDKEVHVTYDDQQCINRFARVNSRLQDVNEELDSKKKYLQNLEDAADEILMIDGESEFIPYQIGEVFLHSSIDETNEILERSKSDTENEISKLQRNSEDLKQILSDLKVKLYAKFGDSINLEAEEK